VDRVAGTLQTYGSTTIVPNNNPVTITVFQALTSGAPTEFTETADFTYDKTTKNSPVAGDNTAPVLADPQTTAQTATSISLHLEATDANDVFYLITDAANNFTAVSFLDDINIALTAGVAYNLEVRAIDFSGNESAAKTVVVAAAEVTYITEGTAQAISFKLDSRSLNELKIQCTSNDLIGDAFVKLELNGTAIEGEWKPTIGGAGTQTYEIIVPASAVPGWDWTQDAVLGLNLGYITVPIGDWGHYVVENKIITAGENMGAPILHKIGTGTDLGEPEPEPTYNCANNLLDGAELSVGDIYYAPGWNPITTYTATYANGEFNLNLPDATYEPWQGQFRLVLATPLTIDATKTFGISMDVETNNNLPFYAKIFAADDNSFLEIPRTTINAPQDVAQALNINVVGTLTTVTQILFDFAGNAANTVVKISNITLCDELSTGVNNIAADNVFAIYPNPAQDVVTISGLTAPTLVTVMDLTGKTVLKTITTGEINLSGVSSGMYLLNVKKNTLKLMKK
jgi:hypothetical protein